MSNNTSMQMPQEIFEKGEKETTLLSIGAGVPRASPTAFLKEGLMAEIECQRLHSIKLTDIHVIIFVESVEIRNLSKIPPMSHVWTLSMDRVGKNLGFSLKPSG